LEVVKGQEIEIPILLAAFGPMRRGEICALTSDDVNGNIITVNKSLVRTPDNNWVLKAPKTYSSYRQIEYPDFVIEKIKNINGNLTTMSPSAITNAFLKILRKNNMPEFRFHDLRHYAVSTLHSINVPDKYIMARGGWATNHTMNNVYNHILQSKKDELSQKITTHFNTVYND
jgi:integrase